MKLRLTMLTFVAAAAAATWSCSNSPVSPTTSGLGAGQDVQAKGKPQPPPPPSSYTVSLGPSIHDDAASSYPGSPGTHPDASQDGLPSPGVLLLSSTALSGQLAGPNSNGNFTGSLSGMASGFTITDTAELPDWYDSGDPCQDSQDGDVTTGFDDVDMLRNLGLVGPGTSLSGDLSIEFGQLTGPNKREPRAEWQLANVLAGGQTWTLQGRSGASRAEFFPAYESGSTADDLTVTVENSRIDFVGPTTTVHLCRADFTMTVSKNQ